jgi:TonB-dependent receptor
MSTTGGADASGGANRNRQFDFNVFASDLFNSITVRKTPSADVEEGSLGATVDMMTARPFDYRDDFVFAASAQAGYNDFSEKANPRLSALVSKRFADDRLGVLLSASYSTRDILEEGPSTVRWEPASANGGFHSTSTRPTGASDNNYFHPRIPRYDSYSYDTERLGLTGTIQWAPTDRTLVSLDALYSNFQSQRAEQYLEAISFSRSGTGKPQTVILPGAIVDDTNSLVAGTFNNVDVRVESRYDELETKFSQFTERSTTSLATCSGSTCWAASRSPSSKTRFRPPSHSMSPTSRGTASTSATTASRHLITAIWMWRMGRDTSSAKFDCARNMSTMTSPYSGPKLPTTSLPTSR